MVNTKEQFNEYLNSVDDVCMECALMSEENCKQCPVQITVKQLEEYFEKQEEDKHMKHPEDIRRAIIEALFNNPRLGENYIDWHTESGECGVTLIYKNANQKFDIIIRPNKEETK